LFSPHQTETKIGQTPSRAECSSSSSGADGQFADEKFVLKAAAQTPMLILNFPAIFRCRQKFVSSWAAAASFLREKFLCLRVSHF
jgi:hypothetical protein